MPIAKWRSITRLALALTILLILVWSVFFLGSIKKTKASGPNCGDVLVSGSSWAGGNGVDVHSNGTYEGTTVDCKTNSPTASYDPYYNINPDSKHNGGVPQYGYGWQCVELVQRMYETRGWTSGIWTNVPDAAAIYTSASQNGMTATANGSITLANIALGDMIVTHEGGHGHVMLVDHISGNTIYYIDQNGKDGGSGTAAYDPSTKKISAGSYYQVSGIVHSPNDKLTNSSSIIALKSGLSPSGATETFAATNSRVTEGWYYDGGNGVHTFDAIDISQHNIVSIDKLNIGSTEALYTAVSDGVWETTWVPGGGGPQSAKIVTGLSGVRSVFAENTIESGYRVHHLYILASDGPYEAYWKDSDPTHTVHVSRLVQINGGVAMTHALSPTGAEQLYVAVPTWVYEVSWFPGGTISTRTVINIMQGDIRGIEKGANLPSGGQLLYTTTSTTVWQTYWNGSSPFSNGTIATNQVNAFQSLKVVTPDGVHHLYLATPDHVQEYWWLGSKSGGGELIRIAQNNISAIAQQLDGSTQLLFTAAGNNVWETWWYAGRGPSNSLLFTVTG